MDEIYTVVTIPCLFDADDFLRIRDFLIGLGIMGCNFFSGGERTEIKSGNLNRGIRAEFYPNDIIIAFTTRNPYSEQFMKSYSNAKKAGEAAIKWIEEGVRE